MLGLLFRPFHPSIGASTCLGTPTFTSESLNRELFVHGKLQANYLRSRPGGFI